MDNELKDTRILIEMITGSTAYNLSIDEKDVDHSDLGLHVSDEDRKGVFIYKNQFTLIDRKETICLHEPEDREYHTLAKFLLLAIKKQNPTTLEMLHTDRKHFTFYDEVMNILLKHKNAVLTKNCYRTFSGYARDQLMRIKNALGSVTKDEKIEHISYSLSSVLYNKGARYKDFEEETGNHFTVNGISLSENGKYKLDIDLNVINGNFDEVFSLLNDVKNTLNNFNNVKSRNRKSTEAKLWKHAMHLVRLVKMGIEILQGKGLIVTRVDDRLELLDIRLGKLTWEEFFHYVDVLFKELDKALEKSTLPEKVDEALLDKVYSEMMYTLVS